MLQKKNDYVNKKGEINYAYAIYSFLTHYNFLVTSFSVRLRFSMEAVFIGLSKVGLLLVATFVLVSLFRFS